MLFGFFLRSFVILSLVVASASALASNSGVTYQGRILKPDGAPLSGANVQFRLQIRTPDAANCLMFEEVQALDMRNSNGAFSLTMADGSGSRMDTTGWNLDRIFANRGTFAFAPSSCTSGTSYAPNPSDGRNFVVLFKDETMSTWEPIPAAKINFVPFAFESKQIAGFGADSLLRAVDSSGDPLTGLAPLSNTQYSELIALVNGTSNAFTKSGQLGGVALPSMTSGEVLGWNGSAWVSQPAVAGPNSVSTTMIQNNAVDSTKIATGAVGTTQIASNVSISTSGTLTSAVTTTRDFKIYAASPSAFYVGLTAPALAASYALTLPVDAGTAGQVLATDGAGILSWANQSASPWTVQSPGINYTAGKVGIGTTSPVAYLHVDELVSDPVGTTYGLMSSISLNNTVSGSQSIYGSYNSVYALGSKNGMITGSASRSVSASSGLTPTVVGADDSAAASGSGNITDLIGTRASIFNGGIGTVTNAAAIDATAEHFQGTTTNLYAGNFKAKHTGLFTLPTAYGIRSDVAAGSSNTITNAYGIYSSITPGSGTITNRYGVYVADVGSGANYYNIYSAGAAKNYFGGSVGIGTTSPNEQLSLYGSNSSGYASSSGAISEPSTGSGAKLEIRNTDNSVNTGAYLLLSSTNGAIRQHAYVGAIRNGSAGDYSPTLVFGRRTGSTDYVESMRITKDGQLGVGVTNPLTKLAVNGSIRVGDGGETCDSTLTGAIRYNGGNLEFCAGAMPWTTLAAAGSGVTSLTGDVTGTGPGATATTVALVGGSTAANVHAAELLANAATNLNTASAIVKRDALGNFLSNNVTLNSLSLNNAGSSLSLVNPIGGNWTMTLPSSGGTSGQVLSTNGSGVTSWINQPTAPWTVQAPGINYMGGKVGIGTTSPGVELEVIGSGSFSGALYGGYIFGNNIGSYRNLTSPGGTAGYWTRIANVQFSQQYMNYYASFDLVSGNVSARGINSRIYFRAKQNNAMGGVPHINVEVDSSNAILKTTDVVAVTTVNTVAQTEVGLYVRMNSNFDAISYTATTAATWSDLIDVDPTPLAAALPAGTQTAASVGLSKWDLGTPANSIAYTAGNVGIGTTSPRTSLDVGLKTDAVILPSGTSAQRPASPVNGMARYNTTLSKMEFYDNGQWVSYLTQVNASAPSGTGGTGYFVLSQTTWDGNLGGLSGANTKCRSELSTYNWKNKPGGLDISKVFAFLCDKSSCQSPQALVNYYYAVANDVSMGGAGFSTDGIGAGPNDLFAMTSTDRFGPAGATYWVGTRGYGDTSWATSGISSYEDCSTWSSNSSAASSSYGQGTNNQYYRFSNYPSTANETCNIPHRLICFVNP